ncbi:MAG: UvrD-helicase domain-containing protein [Spirochaetota bacterium]
MKALLEKLNSSQKEAVLHTDGPLLILAGAGSGKTRVITCRVAYLIKEKKIRPYNIMAVTFTNKAAAEMKKRVIDLVGPEGMSVFIKTFHSASVYILRRFGEKIGIPSSFSIYDTSDQEALIKDILMDMRLDPKKVKPRMIASRISDIKNKAEYFSAGPDSLMPANLPFNFPEIYKVYHQRLRRLCALDFDDLLIETAKLLRECPDELSRMQSMWQYFMIDEYQDTNHAQYLICKHLSSATRNLCVVGDDDQSIYSWRGADIRNILTFEKDYKETRVIKLEENYRSTSSILDSAFYVIKNNQQRKDKRLVAVRGEGEPVIWCRANNEYGEAEYVVNTIISLKNREGLKNRDFAIFYRTNAQSRVFEDFLRRENLPYRIVGGLKFYDRKEIKDILAYLRVIANPADTVSLLRVINTPARGLGSVSIEALRETAGAEGLSEWDIIDKGYPIKGKIPKGLAEFKNIIAKGMEMSRDIPEKLSLGDFVNEIIEITGYKKELEDEDSIESRARLENLDELLNSIYAYEEVSMQATLNEFLQDISLVTSEENPGEAPGETGSITLMTVHIAKGLEFPVVFLTGMEEGTFPHSMSSDTEEGLEEERRLCYVGITRAMNRLYVTNAEIRRSYSDLRYKIPSRFINEIPEELLEVAEFQTGDFSFGTVRSSDFRKANPVSTRINSVPKYEPPAAIAEKKNKSRYSVKEIVMHPKYGTGIITSIKGDGDNTKLTISFNGRSKTFLEKYVNLDRMR